MKSSRAQLPDGVGEMFQLLRDGRPRTRAELVRITGLSRSTVASRLDALVSLGLVGHVGEADSTGGRPSSLLAILPTSRLILSVDIGASHVAVGVADLTGNLLRQRREHIAVNEGPDRVLTWAVESGTELLRELERGQNEVIAMGIGLPGPVEFSTGRPVNPPIMPGWHGLDVKGWLRNHWDVPAFVDNDVNISALGERDASFPGENHLIFVKIATGIGGGVISGGELQRGAQGIAGDIGHVQVSRGAGVPCHCGNRGCLEAVASGPAIVVSLREQGVNIADPGELVERVKGGDLQAVQAVRQAGRDIGEVLTACVSLINPSVIVLGGLIAQAGEQLIAGVREVIYGRSMPLATEFLTVVQSRLGNEAALRGASVLAIDNVLSHEGINGSLQRN